MYHSPHAVESLMQMIQCGEMRRTEDVPRYVFSLQLLAQNGTVVNGSNKADQIYKTGDTVNSAKLLV